MSSLQDELNQVGQLDYAIVGGGVSGIYSGWRLKQGEESGKVAIFEMSDRPGGRLLSWLPYGPESGLRAELGGMRFFVQQQLVWCLINHLKLPMTDFYVDGQNLLWYLRGERVKQQDPVLAAARYSLDQGERGKQPAALLQHFINLIFMENKEVIKEHLGGQNPVSREDWDKIKPFLKYKNQSLWNLGFWNVLSDSLSYEAYQYTTDAFGYYSLTSNWNAAEAMQSVSLDFTQTPTYKTLVQGYSHLPEALWQKFNGFSGAHSFLETQFLRFEAASDGTFKLFFKRGQETASTYAEHLILALPQHALKLIEPSELYNPEENSALKEILNSVMGYPAFKLFLLYEERWWETNATINITHGRSVCDLPIRQTYYFRPDACESQEQTSSSECAKYGLLMASYDDIRAVDYWKGMEDSPENKQIGRQELREQLTKLGSVFSSLTKGEEASFKHTYIPPSRLHKATQAMLRQAKNQLALLHNLNLEDIPDPLVGAYADWSLDPYGGGWNFWQPHVQVEEVMGQVKKPLGDQYKVYIVGEAYSGAQGWVEGALTTAELVLQKVLGLSWPEWLNQGYYLGW